MNRFQYALRLVAARFGVVAPRHYLRVATEESILLKEAEALVGKMAWRELESVEDVTTEYWRLRQLDAEERKLQDELATNKAEHERVQDLATRPESVFSPQLDGVQERLEAERTVLTERLRALQERIKEAERIRKKFNGLKLKLTVLKSEGTPADQLEAVRGELQSIKASYGEIAREVENLREEISLLEGKVKAIEGEEQQLRAQISHHERVLTREVSEVSRRLVETNSRLAVIDGEKRELFGAIGKHLCRSRAPETPATRAATRKFSPVVGRARNLARSIEYNRRLADYR